VNPGHIFISHASKDDDFVKQLRIALEGHQLSVWVDSRNLRGGAKLAPEIEQAIETARQIIAVLSPNTINSPWVRKEIQKALEVEKQRKADSYCVIPLLLPGVEPSALALWFDEEPVGVKIQLQPGGLSEAMPQILAALGERAPDDVEPGGVIDSRPLEELILKLHEPRIETRDCMRRVKARAQLIYQPSDRAARKVESGSYYFIAPLDPIDAPNWQVELRWYLEQFYLWPTGIFVERAQSIEEKLPQWGRELFQAAASNAPAQAALITWLQTGGKAERRFSIEVDSDVIEDPGRTDEEKQAMMAEAGEAASELLSLPWELLHDGRGFLFHGANPARVRRRLPNRYAQKSRPVSLPIRILLVSPRPEEEGISWIDHRISARPLVEAIEELGELATLTMLNPPTFPALVEELTQADEVNRQYDVIHFDGHGVYDRRVGLGGLCFEDPRDGEKPAGRAMRLIHAEKLAEVIRERRIPLIFLEACQSAKTEANPTASVAARLLQEGAASVVAMSHSVLVETSRRFVAAFYRSLAEGNRIGAAMLAGQRALHSDTWRGKVMGAGDLHLQDWFVPVLYQEEQDPPLVTRRLSKAAQQIQQKPRRIRFGALPAEPSHSFIGRSRELLALERLLSDDRQRYIVVRGVGGQGKTTLAAELARWLVRTERFKRAAFVSLEEYTDARGALDSIGRQLLPEGDNWSVAHFSDLRQALQPVERALRDQPTIILLDNLESVLPSNYGVQSTGFSRNASEARPQPAEAGTLNAVSENGDEHDAAIAEIFSLCHDLLDADPATRLLFTTREPAPPPFNHRHREIALGVLRREEAIELVSQIMARGGLTPKADDPGGDPREITDLVEAVNCHARALTLLASEVARRGVRATTENLCQLMAELDRKHPGDRENSLYASVELSLRRLSPENRELCKALGVFHCGANLGTMALLFGGDEDKAIRLSRALVEVGLAEEMGHRYLRLDPALPNYLLSRMSVEERETARVRWAAVMQLLTVYLVQQQNTNAQFVGALTLLELPNLMALLSWSERREPPERMAELAFCLETLLANLGRPQALAQASRARERAARGLTRANHVSFLAEASNIDRLLESGQLAAALSAARRFLTKSQAENGKDFPKAAQALAYAHFQLGRALGLAGEAEAALKELAEAQQRFEALAVDSPEAESLVACALSESGNCLMNLGRLDAAAASYEDAIERFEKLADKRWIAVNKGQLGSVRLLQKRYEDALKLYAETKTIFESLGEPNSIATLWHQIAIVHRQTGQFEQAERDYRQSLAIKVQQNNPAGEADTLGELGNLYNAMGRLDEAATVFRQAAAIYARLQDRMKEGTVRNNLAGAFINLQRYDEARVEIRRSIECMEPFGHAAQIWLTWGNLYDLERANGRAAEAADAREKAIRSYLSYRRDGGVSQTANFQLYTGAARAIEEQRTSEMEQLLGELTAESSDPRAQAVFAALQAILRGDRNPTLAHDPDLVYGDAAELQLLLEKLAPAKEKFSGWHWLKSKIR
jgi:tetratricopeptide (TPR) repeat protein